MNCPHCKQGTLELVSKDHWECNWCGRGVHDRATTIVPSAQHAKRFREKLDKVFAFIVAYKQTHDGNSPTVREIGKACGISSTSVVMYALHALAAQDRIKFTRNVSRTIQVVNGRWVTRTKDALCGLRNGNTTMSFINFHDDWTTDRVDKWIPLIKHLAGQADQRSGNRLL